MPKIIENIRDQLLTEAKKQMTERAYSDITIRSIASACSLGVGTVYNYFKSKEMLIGSVLYEEWKMHLAKLHSFDTGDPYCLFHGIYDSICSFTKENEKLFSDENAMKLASTSFSNRHRLLRDQIAFIILPLCKQRKVDNAVFTSQFISESLIAWSVEGKEFDTVYPLLEKLI